jgi:hypothetical protein
MKLGVLRSIGHNIADSVACGNGFVVGICFTDIFGEARRSAERCIVVDFLSGTIVKGKASSSLAGAIALYGKALPAFCAKHRASSAMFRGLIAQYSVDVFGPRFAVMVEDREGRHAVDEYVGLPGRRIRTLDHLGRLRRKLGRVRVRRPFESFSGISTKPISTIDYVLVNRKVHEMTASHGAHGARLYALELARRAEGGGHADEQAFWQAVAASLVPR